MRAARRCQPDWQKLGGGGGVRGANQAPEQDQTGQEVTVFLHYTRSRFVPLAYRTWGATLARVSPRQLRTVAASSQPGCRQIATAPCQDA